MRAFCLFFSCVLFSHFAIASAMGADLITNDSKLIQHIKKTDPVFSAVLGNCSNEVIQRTAHNMTMNYVYSARCAIKSVREDDCPEYIVHAIGTIDSADWETVRELRLELQCTN